MKPFFFAIKTFLFYWRQNLTTALGVAISTAVLTGGMIIGDSVSFSLEKGTSLRLGKTQMAISGNGRIFTSQLAGRLEDQLGMDCTPLLQLNGSASADGGRLRINRIQVNGVDHRFDRVAGTESFYGSLENNEVIISENLASRLELEVGDFFVLRIQKASVFPLNTPFVSADNTSISIRVKVKYIAGPMDLGRFNLKISQTAPFNIFIQLDHLNRAMDLEGRANLVLVSGENAPAENSVFEALKKTLSPADAGLQIRSLPDINTVEVRSERVFLEQAIVNLFKETGSAEQYILTYFVNSLRYRDNETPYSFVSTLDELTGDQAWVNKWLAEDIGIGKGDTLEMDFFVPGPLRRLDEHSAELVVEDILEMESLFLDETLVPDLPGLSDAGHCRDWEAGIPIDLEKIREKDEDYWNRYRGSPKAFISHERAEELWKNRFGEYTAIRFSGQDFSEEQIGRIIEEKLDPVSLGITALKVRETGFKAAREGVDFSQLFISLSFLVLVSAIILTLLLFRLNLTPRIAQAGTLSAMGYSRQRIRRIFVTEGAFTSLSGGIPGIFLAILFTGGVFQMLGSIWSDIIRTSVLQISLQPLTLLTGYIISVLLSLGGIFLVINRNLLKYPGMIHKASGTSFSGKPSFIYRIMAILSMISALVIIALQMAGFFSSATVSFVTAGGMILISLILFHDLFFSHRNGAIKGRLTLQQMILLNTGRNRLRRFAIIILFALGTYSIILTGSNRKGSGDGPGDKSGGTGGFEFYAESTIPVLYDLNDVRARKEAGIEGEYSFIQFRKNDGDDASCLNLNRVMSPVLVGVDPAGLAGRFRFVSSTEDLDKDNPWNSLEKKLPGGVVPAIADQTVIQWGLGKKVGDTLFYRNETGDTLKVKLVGGIAPSVMQGNVIISDQNFLMHYPSSSGASIYLIEAGPEGGTDPVADLSRALRDNGWFITPSSERLAEFESVQNTYLSIFSLLGVLALLIGTVGLGIVLVRDIMDRRNEIGLLQSLGYNNGRIFRMLFWEYILLISSGIFTGFVAGLVSIYPEISSVGYSQALRNLLVILLVLLANGLIWISIFVGFNINKNYEKILSRE